MRLVRAAPAPASRPSYDGAAYDALLFGTSVPAASSSWSSSYGSETPGASAAEPAETPSYLTSSYGTSAHETPAYETTSYGTSAYEPLPYESPSWAAGSTSWSADPEPASAVAPAAPPVTEPPAPRAEVRPEVPASGHARLEQILAESGVEAPSGGRSRRRRYRDEDGESAGDDVLSRVLGRG